MNGPRSTAELLKDADTAHRIALATGNPDLVTSTKAILDGLEELDISIEHAVTTLRRGLFSTNAQRQLDERKERERWTTRT